MAPQGAIAPNGRLFDSRGIPTATYIGVGLAIVVYVIEWTRFRTVALRLGNVVRAEGNQGLALCAALPMAVWTARMSLWLVHTAFLGQDFANVLGSFWAAFACFLSAISPFIFSFGSRRLPFLLNAAALLLIVFIVGNLTHVFWSAAVAVAVSELTVALCLRGLRGMFTLGEATLIGIASGMLAANVARVTAGHMLDVPGFLAAEDVAVLGLVFAAYVMGLALIPAFRTFRAHGVVPPVQVVAPMVGVLAGTYIWLWRVALQGGEPFTWILTLAFSGPNPMVMLFWLLCLAVSAVVVPRIQFLSNIIVRKYYHLLAVVIFVPPAIYANAFLKVALAVAFLLLVGLEFLRATRCEPVGHVLHALFTVNTDERDDGNFFIVTHLYLLVGCAFPLWMSEELDTSNLLGPASISAFAGILVLGIGDAMASVVGSTCGRTKLPGSNKTIEGTLAGIVSVLLGMLAIAALFGDADVAVVDMETLYYLAIRTSLVAVLEAVTCQIDNLLLPVVFYILLASIPQ